MKGICPATSAPIDTYDEHDEGQVEDRHSSAEPTFESVKDWSVAERETTLAAVATLLRERTDEYAELMTRELGKPAAQAEVEECAWVCERYAEHAGRYLQPEQHQSPPGSTMKTVHEQVTESVDAEEVFGPVAVIYRMPNEDAGIKEFVNRKTGWRQPPAARDGDEVPTE